MDPAAIEQLILQSMPDARVSVESDDQVHYVARIVTGQFEGCSRLERHRKVHQAIGPALGREIHALSLDLKTPSEAGNG